MLPSTSPVAWAELPRALQHLLASDPPATGHDDLPATVARRSFLKLAGVGGLALGFYPLAMAQAPAAASAVHRTTVTPGWVAAAARTRSAMTWVS